MFVMLLYILTSNHIKVVCMQSVLIRDICCFLVSFKNSFRIVSIDRHGLCKHVFFTQQIIIDFALADLKKEEEEKAQHKKQVLAEIVEPLEDSYSLEDMTSCMFYDGYEYKNSFSLFSVI